MHQRIIIDRDRPGGHAEPRYGQVPNFTGEVEIVEHAQGATGATVLTVRFSAGAHTAWHRHEGGQYLESVDGIGWVCVDGGEPLTLAPGDRVWCPPGVFHRHGAAADTAWLQFSLTLGATEWGGPAEPLRPHA